MKLVDRQYCTLIEGFFPPRIISGFSNIKLEGNLPEDIQTALSFVDREPKLSYLNQIHSAKVFSVDKGGCYQGDALFTKSSNLVLVVKTADCLPLFFASSQLAVVGVVHMGWRSAKAGILNNIPYDLGSFKVVAGVGLRSCCYQVGEDFLSHQPLKPFIERTGSKAYFNPLSFAKAKLIEQGLREENFLDLDICSLCSPTNFFSFRRDKTNSRMLSFILKI